MPAPSKGVIAEVPTYPQFEKIFEEGKTEPFLRLVERTRLHLQQIKTNAKSAAERDRAILAYDAYTRALALLKEVDDERRRMAETDAGDATSQNRGR